MNDQFNSTTFSMAFIPDKMNIVLQVSIIAERFELESGSTASPRIVYVAPKSNWITYSKQLHENDFLRPEELGVLDALIFRGETSSYIVVCDEFALLSFGFVRKPGVPSALLSRERLVKRLRRLVEAIATSRESVADRSRNT